MTHRHEKTASQEVGGGDSGTGWYDPIPRILMSAPVCVCGRHIVGASFAVRDEGPTGQRELEQVAAHAPAATLNRHEAVRQPLGHRVLAS